jgi:hypothetical protein
MKFSFNDDSTRSPLQRQQQLNTACQDTSTAGPMTAAIVYHKDSWKLSPQISFAASQQ